MANVLIVEDDIDTLEMSRELIASAGHSVRTSSNGAEGLQALRANPLPDCLLLDVDMPLLNGPGMALQMMLHDQGEERIPIVLVSGRQDLPQLAALIGTPYFLRKASESYCTMLLEILSCALRERQAPFAAKRAAAR